MYSNVQKLQERIKFVPVSQLINKYHQYIFLDFGIKGYDPIGGGQLHYPIIPINCHPILLEQTDYDDHHLVLHFSA